MHVLNLCIATLARQRADVDTARNQLKAEQESLSREKAEGEQMTRRNKILSIQLTELQDQLDRQSSSTSVVPKESEEQITERRQQQVCAYYLFLILMLVGL
jgi:regulator of replication initiation timing